MGEASDASRVCPQLVRPKNPHGVHIIDCRGTHSPGRNSTDSFERRALQSQRRVPTSLADNLRLDWHASVGRG